MAIRGARAAAAAISGSTNPVRATRPAIPMPKGVSRTSSAMRSAASADARTSSLARAAFPRGAHGHIQHHAAADGRHRRKHADDETVSRQQQGRIAQHQPHVRRAARLERSRSFQQPHLGLDLRRSAMEVHRRAVLQRFRRGQKLEPAIHLLTARNTPGSESASPRANSAGSMSARFTAVRWPATARSALAPMHLDAAHAQPPPRGVQLHLLLPGDRARDQRAGGHRAEAFHRKHAVDGQAEMAGRILLRRLGGHARQRLPQFLQPRARYRADRHHGRAFQERAGHQFFHLGSHQRENVVIHQVGLGERDHAARNPEQPADIEVLAGLRLDGFVGRDDEQHQVDSAHAGEHVLDEALVAGHVHEAQPQSGRQLQVGEAQIDGDAAALLFLEAVRVDAGERLDQGGLAVIDVPGGADDDVLHDACYSVKVLALLLLALVAGSLVYCVLTIVAAVRYRAVRPPELRAATPISVLKPLAGLDDGLEANLRTFFEQSYPRFELLFAVRSPGDPAIAVVERLRKRYPAIPSRLIVVGEPPYPNAKVYSLDRMLAAAEHDLLVMADSDIRVTPDMLSTIAAEFQDERLGLATCPYRAVPGRSFWSTLEAIGLNTEFIGGVLVARMLDGMKFALGPTIAARRQTLERIGGFDAVKDYLAEDFVMGKLAAERGDGVILSSYVIEHLIGAQPFAANMRHRLRWNRSTRRSRPMGLHRARCLPTLCRRR